MSFLVGIFLDRGRLLSLRGLTDLWCAAHSDKIAELTNPALILMVLARVILFPVSNFMSLCSSATILVQVVPIMLPIKMYFCRFLICWTVLVGMGQAAMFKCCPVEYFLIIFTINCVFCPICQEYLATFWLMLDSATWNYNYIDSVVTIFLKDNIIQCWLLLFNKVVN